LLKNKNVKKEENSIRGPGAGPKGVMSPDLNAAPECTPAVHLNGSSGVLLPRRPVHGVNHRCATAVDLLMILLQVNLRKPCYDFYSFCFWVSL